MKTSGLQPYRTYRLVNKRFGSGITGKLGTNPKLITQIGQYFAGKDHNGESCHIELKKLQDEKLGWELDECEATF